MSKLKEVLTLATRNVTTADRAVSGAFADVDAATVAGCAALAVTGGAAAFVGAAVLPGQVAVGVTTGGLFLGLGEVNRRTGSYLPFLDSKEGRERNQARADRRNAERDAKADAAVTPVPAPAAA